MHCSGRKKHLIWCVEEHPFYIHRDGHDTTRHVKTKGSGYIPQHFVSHRSCLTFKPQKIQLTTASWCTTSRDEIEDITLLSRSSFAPLGSFPPPPQRLHPHTCLSLLSPLSPGWCARWTQLADFGLARSVADGPLGGTTCGTSSYMAPESLKLLPHGTQVSHARPRYCCTSKGRGGQSVSGCHSHDCLDAPYPSIGLHGPLACMSPRAEWLVGEGETEWRTRKLTLTLYSALKLPRPFYTLRPRQKATRTSRCFVPLTLDITNDAFVSRSTAGVPEL